MRAQTLGIAALLLFGAWIVQLDSPRAVLGHGGGLRPAMDSELKPEAQTRSVVADPLRVSASNLESPSTELSAEVALPNLDERGSPHTELHGIVLDTDGSPAAGAVLQFRSRPVEEFAARLPERVSDVAFEFVTDESGRFGFESPNDVARSLTLRLERGSRAPVEWALRTTPGARKLVDLHAVRLERTAILRGTVVDASGEAMRTGWTVHARRLDVPSGMHRVAATHVASPGDSFGQRKRGRFEFSALAPGTYELVTRFIDGIVQRGPEFAIDAGEDRSLQIERNGPLLNAAILCQLESQHPRPRDLRPDGFVLRSADGETHPLQLRGSMLAAYDLAPGTYSLEIREGRYTQSRLTNLHPGGLPRTMKLIACGALQLDVRSALTGERIEKPWVQLHSDRTNASVYTLQAASERAPAQQLYTDLALPLRERTTLIAGAAGWVTERGIELDALPLQPTRTVEIRLRPGTWIEGRFLIRGSARPFAGDLEVYVHELSQDGEHWRSAPTTIIPCPARGDGRFVLEALPPGRLLLEAHSQAGGGGFHGSTIAPALAANTQATPLGIRRVRIELNDPGFVDIQLAGFPLGAGAESCFEGYEARLVHPRGTSVRGSWTENSLRAGPLLPGAWALELYPRDLHALERGTPVHLAEITVLPGNQTIPLRPILPARVETELRVDGESIAGATVRLHAKQRSLSAESDVDGFAQLGLIPRGHYEIWVEGPPAEPWVLQLPGQLTVPESARLTRAIDLHRVAGEILLIDGPEANEPLRDALVVLSWPGHEGWREQELRTDSRGVLRLELPPGSSFVLSRGGEASARRSQVLPTVEWTRNGPSRSVIRLPY